jgi:hypothetical protein
MRSIIVQFHPPLCVTLGITYIYLFIESNMLLSTFKKSCMVKLKNINNTVMISSLTAVPGNKRK